MKIRYSEIFNSFQGEAGFAGMPTVWLRTFGCNLECNGFGQKDPTDPSSYVLPYQTIELKNFTKLEELPVFPFGCDSSYSWSNRYKHLVHTKTVEEIADELWQKAQELGANSSSGGWVHWKTDQPIQLCFTGGEPGLWDKQLAELIEVMESRGQSPFQITIETNGTKQFPAIAAKCNRYGIPLYFSISPKLYTVSGEKTAVDYGTIVWALADYQGWLKFVVDGTDRCWEELEDHLNWIKNACVNLTGNIFIFETWIMPVGATKESQEGPTIAQIANEGMKRGYKIATRNHTYVYGNVIGS
jgi:organic radical activating enzyme